MARALSRSTTLLAHLSHGRLENAHGLQPFTSEEPLRRSLLLNAHSHLTRRSSSLVSLRSLIPAGAPGGQHTAWAYCHVPNGSTRDATKMIERQITRFAPEFPDCILSRCVSSPASLERWNPNLVGGDILGGAMNVGQLLFRPTSSLYRTPRPGLYFCGASAPPGGGVHGMCGYHAANAALRDIHYRES
jgi:phytoene dehydrogenase-like protein